VLNLCALEKRNLIIGDIPAAYLQTDYVSASGEIVRVRMDKHSTRLCVMAYPQYAAYVLDDGTMICAVNKALYGLVESAHLWYNEITSTLSEAGFVVTDSDMGIVQKRLSDKDHFVASIHSDDILSAATPTPGGRLLEKEFWGALDKKYPGIVYQRGPKYKHLSCGIEYTKETATITKDQTAFIRKMLITQQVTGYENYPARANFLTERKDTTPISAKLHAAYRSALQQAAWVLETRPEVGFVISFLQRRANAPTKTDLDDLCHLFRYFNKYPNIPLVYKPTHFQICAFADASFAVDPKDDRSQYGYTLSFGGASNAVIASKSGSIKVIVRSSTEAEIHAVNELISELLQNIDLLNELGYKQESVLIHEDNDSCITMMQRAPRNFQTASKHVRVKWRFFRELYKNRALFLKFCPTAKMTADVLTKPLTGNLFRDHCASLHGMTAKALEGCVVNTGN
jgi:hypothetical protein